nr:NAD(P)(+) transhydrogenase (Re/Si-specific) subunit alpha [Sandarakinorhabdus sp.]
RPAPRLITDAQVASMRPGSVIVDLAVDSGGNVEGAVAGEVLERHGVKIIGHRNPASRMAPDASALYSRNLFNMISAFWDKEAKATVWPADDDIVKGIKLTEGGKIVNERLLG